MAEVEILAFSDGRDAVHRDIEKYCRNVMVCELLDVDCSRVGGAA